MFKADGTRREFALRAGATVLGRKNTCDLRIPLTSVSRQHCEIRVEDGAVLLRDLGSSNGTYHNGSRVQEAELAAGDEVVVGPVNFRLTVDGQPEDLGSSRTNVGLAAIPAAAPADDNSPTVDLAAGIDPAPPSDSSADPTDDEDDDLAEAMAMMDVDDPEGSSAFSLDFGDDSGLDVEVLDAEDDDDL